jgi:hypothetical protein
MINHETRIFEKKLHKVVIIDSHARQRASEVRQLLYNEVLGFVNPGSGMKFTQDTAKISIQQLTKKAMV